MLTTTRLSVTIATAALLVFVSSAPAMAETIQGSHEEPEFSPRPSPPMNVQAKVRDDGESVLLTWDSPLLEGSSPVDQYKVYRNGGLIAVVSSDDYDYVDSGVVDSTTTLYHVTARNSDGEGLPGFAYPGSPQCIMVVPEFPFVVNNIPDCFKQLPIVGPIYEEHLHPIYVFVRDSIPS